MSKRIEADNDLGTLAQDARALLSATAKVAGEKVSEARKRLAATLESVDESVRDNPYQAIAIAIGVGALLGYLIMRRCSSGRD